MHFDLRRIDSDEIPIARPTLEADAERVRMVRRIPGLPSIASRELPRRQLVSARVYTAEKIEELKTLDYVAQQAVNTEASGPGDRFLVLQFDVNGGQAAWVLKGTDDELLRAEHALLMPSSKLADAAQLEQDESFRSASSPTRDPSPQRLMWTLVGVGTICAVLGFLFLLFGGGGRDSTRPIPANDGQAQVAAPDTQDGQTNLPPASPAPPRTAIPADPIEVSPSTLSPLAAGQLPAAAAALTRQLNRRPRVYRIVAGESSATFEVYAAGRADVLESWKFSGGTLIGPSSVGPPPLEGGEFSLNDVRLARVPEVVARAKRRVNAGDPAQESATVVIRRNLPRSERLRMRIDVSGPRSANEPPVYASPGGRIVTTP